MAEEKAGQQVEGQEEGKQEQVEGTEGTGEQAKQAERVYTQAELDRILGKVRKNARYLGRKEAEAELMRQGATRQEAQQTVERQQEQPKGPPKREEFENYEDYLIAKADHAARQASREEREAADKTARERTVAEEKTRTQREFKKRAEAVMKENPEWAEKIESAEGVMITDVMGEAIQESEEGPRVLEFLVDNPDEAERIAKLPAKAQLREIGKLEARIEAGRKPKAKPQGEEGDEGKDEQGDEREESEAEAKGKDAERNDDGTFKPQKKRTPPDPIEPGTGRGANTNALPSDKDDTDTWLRKRQAQLEREGA